MSHLPDHGQSWHPVCQGLTFKCDMRRSVGGSGREKHLLAVPGHAFEPDPVGDGNLLAEIYKHLAR
eukprot:1195823-Prorocentrum_minimum.AAC.16